MKWYEDKIFWYIFTALAAVKLAAFTYICFFHPGGERIFALPDSLGYVYPAQTLLQQGAMWEAVSAAPMLLRTPGYPLFLAFVQLITGSMTWSVALWQNILSLLMLIPVYLSADKLAGRNAARWAVFFCAASVLYFSMAFAVLTETLCAFLLAWFLLFIIRFFQTPRALDLLTSALFLAAAVYVRPAAYYFMPFSALLLLCLAAGKLIRFPWPKILLYFLVPLILTGGGWQVRNFLATGFGGFTSVGAFNLYFWNEDYVARKYGMSVSQAHEAMQAMLPPEFSSLPPAEQVKIYKALAAPLIRESFLYKLSRAPLWAGKTLLGTNFAHTASLLNISPLQPGEEALNHTGTLPAEWQKSPAAVILFLLCAAQVSLTVLLGAAGLWILWKKKPAETFFLLVYCLYFWGIGSVFSGAYARFRAPFEFVLCITAGVFAAHWLQKRKKA
ncbi:MAG: glycosyltransferase family 39 protein [Elusimicrobiaceae bacterium]|nr:glycosyltransferase family 39 protein [Elusimicrobiaceae bacterium]